MLGLFHPIGMSVVTITCEHQIILEPYWLAGIGVDQEYLCSIIMFISTM